MPTYDYTCDACGHTFEEFQNITAEMLTKCPKCKKKKLRRLFGTGAALVFKGSGFYQTDYRSEGYKKAVAAEKNSSSSEKSSSGDSSKSDSKNSGSTGSDKSGSATAPAVQSDSPKTSSKKSKPKD